MTRHEALTRAAELLRLHMSTPPAEVLATLDEMAAQSLEAREAAWAKARAERQAKRDAMGWRGRYL